MVSVLRSLLRTLRTLAYSHAALHLEILALRLDVLQRTRPHRVRLAKTDRWFWVMLGVSGPDGERRWSSSSRRPSSPGTGRASGSGGPGRVDADSVDRQPTAPAEIRRLIRTMANANPRWGAPRIHGELLKLGIDVCQSTVAKYMGRRRPPPSQTWRTFPSNHVGQIVAADFFVVPTVTFRLVFVLVLLAHDRRRIRHVAVTAHPTAAWAEVVTAPHAPWQNPFVERFVGSARRECFDHVIAFNEAGVRKLMTLLRLVLRKSPDSFSAGQGRADPRPGHAARPGRRRREP
jgi:putative transposase